MKKYNLPIVKQNPYNEEQYYKVTFRNISGMGLTPKEACERLKDAILHVQFNSDIHFDFKLDSDSTEVELSIGESNSFYLL